MNNFYTLSENIVFRIVSNELIVIHTESGILNFFSSGTRPFLEFFLEGNSIEAYLENLDPQLRLAERQHMESLLEILIEHKILEPVQIAGEEHFAGVFPAHLENKVWERPAFLRTAKQDLDTLSTLGAYD